VAIERGYFRRLGGTSQRQVDARIMAATNADLDRRVKDGHFRADLYYRLKMFCVELPPLRERGDDLLLLSDHFLERFCRKFHRSPIRLAENARMRMRAYTWPGNVRELSNVLQRAALLHAGDVLEAAMLGLDDVSHDIEARRTGMRFDFHRDDCTWSDVEKQLLAAALRHTAGNISEAARVLGMTRGGLRHRMDKLGIHL
jgi:DNA-binding NtrC family response regulator